MNYKEFQKAAIKKIVRGYESDEKNNRFLVADEVGLGKTIIAKGTIRCLFYFEYLKQCCPKEFTYNVLYLCSNLNIAEQNKSKLGVSKRDKTSLMDEVLLGNEDFGKDKGNHAEAGSSVENRTTMLLKKLLDNHSVQTHKKHFQELKVEQLRKACVEIYGEEAVREREAAAGCSVRMDAVLRLNILPITTKTSIEIKGKGHQVERAFIIDTMEKLLGVKVCEQGENDILVGFGEKLEYIRKKYPEIQNTENFQKLLCGEPIILDERTEKEEWQKLRQQFALASVEMLKYDFVIMDEFQNFSEILHKANDTEAKKKNYIGKANYIYTALKASGKHVGLAKRIEEEYINRSVTDSKEGAVKLSEADKAFWKDMLVAEELKENIDIDELVNRFTKLAEKRLTWKDTKAAGEVCTEINRSSQEDDQKKMMLRLVKAIVNRDDEDFVGKVYKVISHDEIKLVLDRLECISLEDREKTSTFRKSSLELYREEALGKNKLLQWWEKNLFQIWYQRLRGCGMIDWRGVSKKQVPFRYLLNLHYSTKETEADTNIPNLILNCFAYFMEDSWEKVYLWQYAYLLTQCLSQDDNRWNYTVEQLEPMRVMLGTYVQETESILDLENKCENIVIEKIFNNEFQNGKYTRILMLSATPFRMYITDKEDEETDANIMEVCDFLDTNAQTNLGGSLVVYKNELLQFAQDAGSCIEDVKEKKADFQNSMNKVFTRMERFAVLRELVQNWFANQANGKKEDELICGKIRELFAYLMQVQEINKEGSVISYAEDAPYMGTFMHGGKKTDDSDGYKWKNNFDSLIQNKKIAFTEDSYLYLAKSYFSKKEKPLGLWHGVYEGALSKMLELDSIDEEMRMNHPGAARLLWVPSCVSKAKLKGAFEEHKDYGKTIIFSRLVQVPRMIAGLTGYEELRRLTWLIEENCTEIQIIDRVLNCLGCEEMQGASTYQKLDKILEKSEKNIEKLLLAEDTTLGIRCKGIKRICKEALERYCEKYCKKFCTEKSLESKQADSKKLEVLIDSLAKNLIHNVLLNKQQGMFAIWASEGFFAADSTLEGERLKQAFLEDCKEKILQYCEHGCLSDVLDEWFYICLDGEQDLGEFLEVRLNNSTVDCLSFIRATKLSVSLYENDENGMAKSTVQREDGKNLKEEQIDTYFARCIGMSKDDDKVSSIKGLQQSFNAPFAPFVFATTSMGQEGLDFHHYADKIIHWRLPANPVDFEQREGRINRYHCLALRKKLIEWYGALEAGQKEDVYRIFQKAFENAKTILLQDVKNPVVNSGLVPDWVLLNPEKSESVSIKRYVPYFYLSKTNEDFHKNLKVLQLYRSVIGQNDPEEVMERLMTSKKADEVAQLFVDFSPYNVGMRKI